MKKIIILALLLIQSNFFIAQVKDISFTLSPFAEYNWWDNKSGLEDGILLGGKLGFGFGEYIELRAVYAQSTDLKTNFDNFGIKGFNSATSIPQSVKMTRWGGEFKANIGRGTLNPFINIGTGVQKIELENIGQEFEQIYTALGLGIKTKLTDRIIFTLEGKNTLFNFNSGKNLLTPQDKINYGVTNADFSSDLLSNWSVQGALQFYLGGRSPGTLSELDQAYLKKIKGGFKGLRWVLEPSINYVNFSDKSNFRDTYLLGGYFGLDFNQFTGVRVFYLQANENKQISTRFDELAMYGAEFRARLNDGSGVTPYLILGGGYLNPTSSYVDINNNTAEGQKFASAGLGMNIPLGKNFLITGGARGIVTTGQEIQNLGNPDQLQTHIMYNAGLKLTFGAKSTNPDEVYQSQLDYALTNQNQMVTAEYEERLRMQNEKNKNKLNVLKEQYSQQMDSLQIALNDANKAKDTNKAVAILEQKNKVQKALDDVESVSKVSNNNAEVVPSSVNKDATQPKELIKMTPKELELLIDRILDKTQPQPLKKSDDSSNQSIEVQQLNQRIDILEKLILKSDSKTAVEKTEKLNNTSPTTVVEEVKNKEVATSNLAENEAVIDLTEMESGRFIKHEKYSELKSLPYKGASLFTGINFGDATFATAGVRAYYEIKKTNLEFIPVVYYGFSNPSSWGASGNLVYNFKALKVSDLMTPYAGAGVGFSRIESNLKANYNISFGTNLKFLSGRLFSDITLTNLTDNVQLAVGYRLPF